MRQARHWVVASGLVTIGATMWTAGCGQFYEDCFNGNVCKSSQKAVDQPVCPGSPLDANTSTGKLQAFTENCSIFVASGPLDSLADGTVSHPYNSMQFAINEARGRWVIACNNAVFDESVTTVGYVQVYGGFSCTNMDWQRAEAVKTALAPSTPTANMNSNVVTLTLQNGMGLDDKGNVAESTVRFQDFVIKAPSAATPGGSSIGVIVDERISAELVNCEVTAGNGQPGESAPKPDRVSPDGSQPPRPLPACSNPVKGGVGASTTCPEGDSSRGGDGGDGGVPPSGAGKAGKDGDKPDATHGKGGNGATNTTTGLCGVGQLGADGAAGMDGLGATDFGSLSPTGITSGDGAAGAAGKTGHGGGGGGGASHGLFCDLGGTAIDGTGAGGGGGGSGGCGGTGGGGGKSGGSSIAIISLGPNLKLTEVTLTTGQGGSGGDGAEGLNGGEGGEGGFGGLKGPGPGESAGCDGGKGGNGGLGGSGGGGRGGHSIGLLFKATPDIPPILKASTQATPGSGGSIAQATVRHGGTGLKKPCWDLAGMVACSP